MRIIVEAKQGWAAKAASIGERALREKTTDALRRWVVYVVGDDAEFFYVKLNKASLRVVQKS